MGLAQQLQDVPKGVPHVRCGVDKIRQQLDGEDLAVLNETLAKIASMPGNKRTNGQTGMTVSWLARVLTDNGYKVSKSVLNRHVSGTCACEFV